MRKGFSLVELSVVLAIIGVTLGTALSLATNITEENRIETTEERIAIIEDAVARHLSLYGRIPCPANGALSTDATDFGYENATYGEPVSCNSVLSSGRVVAGTVPVKTLVIPDEMAEDGWGRRFTYVIDERMASSTPHHSNPFSRVVGSTVISFHNPVCDNVTSTECFTYFDPSAGTITINDAATGTPGLRTSEAVLVLISHGKNGHGAYLRQGSATRFDAGYTTGGGENQSAEVDNGSLEAGANVFDNVFVQKEATGLFDDIVSYKLKWQLAESAGGINDDSVCAAAENVVQDPVTNLICTGATGNANCVDMATLVFRRCLEME